MQSSRVAYRCFMAGNRGTGAPQPVPSTGGSRRRHHSGWLPVAGPAARALQQASSRAARQIAGRVSRSVCRFAAAGSPHEPAHGASAGGDAGRVAGDRAGILPSAGELHIAGAGPAGGELDRESDAAAVRRPAPFEAGRGAGGREPAVDLVHPEADGRIGWRRLRRRMQPAERGAVAVDQTGGRRLRPPPGSSSSRVR